MLALERDVDEWTQAPRLRRDYAEIAPRSPEMNHPEMKHRDETPRSRRDRAEITPKSPRDHPETPLPLSQVGFAPLALFRDAGAPTGSATPRQPRSSTDGAACLNEGAFQLPVYLGFYEDAAAAHGGRASESSLSRGARVPCATVLVRLNAGHLSMEPPPYASGGARTCCCGDALKRGLLLWRHSKKRVVVVATAVVVPRRVRHVAVYPRTARDRPLPSTYPARPPRCSGLNTRRGACARCVARECGRGGAMA